MRLGQRASPQRLGQRRSGLPPAVPLFHTALEQVFRTTLATGRRLKVSRAHGVRGNRFQDIDASIDLVVCLWARSHSLALP
jgi:hypothetical protein